MALEHTPHKTASRPTEAHTGDSTDSRNNRTCHATYDGAEHTTNALTARLIRVVLIHLCLIRCLFSTYEVRRTADSSVSEALELRRPTNRVARHQGFVLLQRVSLQSLSHSVLPLKLRHLLLRECARIDDGLRLSIVLVHTLECLALTPCLTTGGHPLRCEACVHSTILLVQIRLHLAHERRSSGGRIDLLRLIQNTLHGILTLLPVVLIITKQTASHARGLPHHPSLLIEDILQRRIQANLVRPLTCGRVLRPCTRTILISLVRSVRHCLRLNKR